ncbi:AtpZ/AtpI family protein [Sutcliffiella cohnii]|uniref:AtpZ/AtpI family protein n=1 Tax=Sutcliffiella cohnii TaxID=33932 RepID=UPI002E1DAA52|nr:AtpZ/AtpI family protein [Sutcliffiella cohnii]
MTNKKHPFRAMALTTSILSYLVGPTLLGIFGGKWVDERFGTSPLFLLVGLILGLATGVYGMMQLLHQYYSGE